MASVVPCINDYSDGIAVMMDFRLGHNNENRFPLACPHWFIKKVDLKTHRHTHEDLPEISVTNCPKLVGVEGLEELRGIKFFKINECPSLQKVVFGHTSSSGEDKADMPQPGYSLDSAEESFLVEQMDLCIEFEPYTVKKLI